jgi:1-acyl-sn-glycerol-3-phosphate acyltransferase
MNKLLRVLFFALIVRPITHVVLGLNTRRRQILPSSGPAIVVANHNSHLDTLVLISLFPLRQIRNIRAVAAADYFFTNPLLGWFVTNIIGVRS